MRSPTIPSLLAAALACAAFLLFSWITHKIGLQPGSPEPTRAEAPDLPPGAPGDWLGSLASFAGSRK